MKYFFSKYKFPPQLFYKNIEKATIEVFSDYFFTQISPYFAYSGKYQIHSIFSEDNEKIIYRTMQVSLQENEIDLDNINKYNEFFIGIYKSGKKATIFQSTMEGIILKI